MERTLRIKLSLRVVIDKARREKRQLSNLPPLVSSPSTVRKASNSFPRPACLEYEHAIESTAGFEMRDTWRIFDCPVRSFYIHILPSTDLDACVCVVSSREKADRSLPVFWIFDEREHDVPPEFHSGPSATPVADIFPRDRFTCTWLSARFCRENRATNENSCLFNAPLLDRVESAKLFSQCSANSYLG